MEIKYAIYRPAGNDTALVYGTSFSPEEKKLINDTIMEKHGNVEQVGFINTEGEPELQMAGGEFCGNATRSVAYHYLNGASGEMKIKVNMEDLVPAGVDEEGKAWCMIPLHTGADAITEIDLPGIGKVKKVKLKGMTHVVINGADKYFDLANKDYLMKYAKDLIMSSELKNEPGAGVMYCRETDEETSVELVPVVWVNAIDTMFLETACGSGSTATAMAVAERRGESCQVEIMQPSGMAIDVDIVFEEGGVKEAKIKGAILKLGDDYSLEI